MSNQSSHFGDRWQLIPTFGVELEFVVQCEINMLDERTQRMFRQTSRGETPGDFVNEIRKIDWQRAAFHRVADVLRAAGLQAELVNERPEPETTFDVWLIDNDPSVEPRRSDPVDQTLAWEAIEVKSPALPATSDSLAQVRRAVEALNLNLTIFVNRSCGLHVHVGYDRGGYVTNTIRSLAYLCLAFEPQINTLHPPHRQVHHFCQLMSSAPALQDQTLAQQLELIAETTEREDLIETVQDRGKHFAYNFHNLHPALHHILRQPQTIEFRQHEGTLVPYRIEGWIRFVVRLVQFALAVEPMQLHQLVRNFHEFPRNSVHDIMIVLGMGDLISSFPVIHPSVPKGMRPRLENEDLQPEWLDSRTFRTEAAVAMIRRFWASVTPPPLGWQPPSSWSLSVPSSACATPNPYLVGDQVASTANATNGDANPNANTNVGARSQQSSRQSSVASVEHNNQGAAGQTGQQPASRRPSVISISSSADTSKSHRTVRPGPGVQMTSNGTGKGNGTGNGNSGQGI